MQAMVRRSWKISIVVYTKPLKRIDDVSRESRYVISNLMSWILPGDVLIPDIVYSFKVTLRNMLLIHRTRRLVCDLVLTKLRDSDRITLVSVIHSPVRKLRTYWYVLNLSPRICEWHLLILSCRTIEIRRGGSRPLQKPRLFIPRRLD